MPWHIGKSAKCPAGKPVAVIKDSDQSVAGCHPNQDSAKKQLAALYANEKSAGGQPMEDDCQECPQERGDHKFQMDDGSYPIDACTGKNSVQSAAKLAHHSKNHTFEQVKAHVMKAKNALGCPDSVLPATWTSKSKEDGMDTQTQRPDRPPRDNLVRGVFPFQLRDDAQAAAGTTMFGHFAVFHRWTEIDSFWEGRFMEQIAPGSFTKTIAENRDNIKVLFNHGKDPQLGGQILGRSDVLKEDDTGAYYEVPLYEGLPSLLLSGLRDGQYGASFRFRVTKEEVDSKPERSDYNPDGIPERTIKEVALAEFGPVTFPAYQDASAGVRSLTDDYILQLFGADPSRVAEFLANYAERQAAALQEHGAEEPHSGAGAATSPQDELAVIPNPNKKR